MKRKELLKAPPCKAPDGRKGCLAAVQTIQAGDGEVLGIDLYWKGTLRVRYFASKQENTWAVHVDRAWKKIRFENAARVAGGEEPVKGMMYEYQYADWEFVSKEDERRAVEYFGGDDIDTFEDRILYGKRQTAEKRRVRRISEEMRLIGEPPGGVLEWLEREVFPEQYLFIRGKGKDAECACIGCGARFRAKRKYRNYERVQCPECGAEAKAEKKAGERSRHKHIVVLQIITEGDGGRWAERQFRAECRWTAEGRKDIRLEETIRAIARKGEQFGKVYYSLCGEWDDRNWQSKRFLKSLLYPGGGLKEALAYAGLGHSGMNVLAAQGKEFNVGKAILNFDRRPWMEYVIKSGLTSLAAEIINDYGYWREPEAICPDAKTLKELLRLDGNRASRLKALNGGLKMLGWLQHEQEGGMKISQESLEWMEKKKISVCESQEILGIVGSVDRMVHYLRKQKGVRPHVAMRMWEDYLDMAAREGMDTSDDIIRLPKDLKARHDRLVEERNARENQEEKERNAKRYAELDRKITKWIPDVGRYFFENAKYLIIPAARCGELVEEGRALHHCVGASGRYMERMASGESWILFLRKKKEPHKPYYTLEIEMKTDRILQWYSEYDRKPDRKKIEEVLGEYQEVLKKARRRPAGMPEARST